MTSTLPPQEPSDGLTSLESEIVQTVFNFQPGYAVFLGLHDYDGRLPDLSPAATASWARRARELHGKVTRTDEFEQPSDRTYDRILLGLLLEGPLFDIEESHELERNPMSYVGQISLTPYLVRHYCPAPQRVASMTRILGGIPRLIETARQRLMDPLPVPFVQLALTIVEGFPSHFAEAQAFANRVSNGEAVEMSHARTEGEAVLADFAKELREEYLPTATPDFALGPARYQKLLWVREGIRTPAAEILQRGWDDLRRNQVRLEKLALERQPKVTVVELLDESFRQHATADGLILRAESFVEETRSFVRSHDLVTIPEPSRCRVTETPSYGRAMSTASMDPPGPFDELSEEGIFYVTPVDPSWPPERQEEWLRSLNDATLKITTIHEVFPGHYLQFLHFRATRSSLARKSYLSAAFTEGWAHYCEQLAIEQGLAKGGSSAEVAQIHDALLRDCRLIASVGLHTQGYTIDWATQLFRTEAHLEEFPAQREAIRGTFNPEYFVYTLGKLAILDVRGKYLHSRFGGSLKRFHDRILGFGCPPVGFLDVLLSAPN
ncbi:MAG: DUF885 domain-containing protein [Thermoplasmata archaeon]